MRDMRRLGLGLGMLVMLCGVSVGEVQAQPNPLQGPFTITVVDAGSCATAGACVSFPLNNYLVGTIEVSGTFTGTLTSEALVNSVWVPITLYDGTGTPFTTVTAPGAFSVANTGFARVRLRAGAFASGTASVVLRQGYFMAKLPGGGARILAPNGTAGAPSYSWTASPTTGLYLFGSNLPGMSISGTVRSAWGNAYFLDSTYPIAWTSGAIGTSADTGISRTGVGVLSIGNGTQGDQSGSLAAATFVSVNDITTGTSGFYRWGGPKTRISSPFDGIVAIANNANTLGSEIKVDALPTVFSGFGTSPSVTAGSTPLAGSVNIGTGGVATGGVIAFNGTAFPAAPFCMVTNATVTTVTIMTAVATTTQLTINADRVIPASSLIAWHCISPK